MITQREGRCGDHRERGEVWLITEMCGVCEVCEVSHASEVCAVSEVSEVCDGAVASITETEAESRTAGA